MDKVEYKIRAKEIVRLAGQKNYKAAAQIADEIRWEKVKNIQMLCTVSEIYEKIGRYDESRDVLLLAYNRSPSSKMIVYRLVDLSIAMKDYQEATDYYHEYVQLAPHDNNALILKYKLYKGKGAKLETLITILEEFKSKDYQEEWILELARLYHQAGDREKCVDICNEMDLWFSKGKSVIQALELKRLYEPLTPLQERKLENREQYMSEETGAYQTPVADEERVEPVQSFPEEQQEYQVSEVHEETEVPVAPRPEMTDRLRAVEAAYTPGLGSRETEPVPVPRMQEPEDPVAAAIVRMARERQNASGELEPGFSILPKGKVVDGDAEEFAFDLPKGVKETQLAAPAKSVPEQEEPKTEPSYEDPEAAVVPSEELEEVQIEDPAIEELEEQHEESALEEEVVEASGTEEKPVGIWGKMFNRLKMEDDELDDDFNDDYVDDTLEEDEDKENGMVTRGLTGQYEKVVIEEDDDEDDPLNIRMSVPDEEDDEEYEYVYGDEDEAEEYEDLEDQEDEQEPKEERLSSRSSKRFNFFRNTMEDDELFEEEVPEEELDAQKEPAVEESYKEPQSMEDVVPLSYAAKYDTLNLQMELAKSIQQLMDATEKETVDSTLQNVKKMVEESHIPELSETMKFKAVRGNMLNFVAKSQAEKLQQAKDIEEVVSEGAASARREPDHVVATADATVYKADARPKPAVELAIKLKPSEEEEIEPLERILTQEDDGQLTLFLPEEPKEEEQIEGQMTFEDVLKEWEKQKLLSENDKEKRALEEARKRALEETQGIMTEIMGLLKDVIPKLGSIKDGEQKMTDLAESLEKVQRSLPYTQGVVEAAENSKEAASAIEAACAEAVEELERMEQAKQEEPEAGEAAPEHVGEPLCEEEPTQEDGLEEETQTVQLQEFEQEQEDDFAFEQEAVTSENVYQPDEMPEEDMQLLGEPTEEESDKESFAFDMDMQMYEEEESEPEENEEFLREQMALHQMFNENQVASEEKTEHMFDDIPEMLQTSEQQEEVSDELMPVLGEMPAAAEPVMQDEEPAEVLNEEQKNILSYFLSVKSVEPLIKSIVKRTEYAPEHMIVTGGKGSGKTSVAMRIIKAAQVNKEDKIEAIAKIKASLLNQKEVTEILDKVNGGVLIIERAGSLNPATVYAIEDALYSNKYYVQMIFVDKKPAIAKLLASTNSFINDIQMRVDLPAYSNNELAEFAKTYAENNGYKLDGMAVLALHSVIELFQTDQHIANLEDIKNIMDEAMERADKRGKKLFGKLFSKKTEYIDLIESDFE